MQSSQPVISGRHSLRGGDTDVTSLRGYRLYCRIDVGAGSDSHHRLFCGRPQRRIESGQLRPLDSECESLFTLKNMGGGTRGAIGPAARSYAGAWSWCKLYSIVRLLDRRVESFGG